VAVDVVFEDRGLALVFAVVFLLSEAYGVGHPRGQKTAAGQPPCGRSPLKLP
jgi:hypothetical protein